MQGAPQLVRSSQNSHVTSHDEDNIIGLVPKSQPQSTVNDLHTINGMAPHHLRKTLLRTRQVEILLANNTLIPHWLWLHPFTYYLLSFCPPLPQNRVLHSPGLVQKPTSLCPALHHNPTNPSIYSHLNTPLVFSSQNKFLNPKPGKIQ